MTIPGSGHCAAEWQIRAALLQVIQCFEPATANEAREKSPAELLQLAQTYNPVPPEILDLIAAYTAKAAGEDALPLEAAAFDLLENWLTVVRAKYQWEKTDVVLPCAPIPNSVEGKLRRNSLPLEWTPLVEEIRFQLQKTPPGPPFEKWSMPDQQWGSLWSEAYRVVSRDDDRDQRGLVVIPSEDSNSCREALEWWRLRIEAARVLQLRAGEGLRWPRVIDCGTLESPAFVILDLPAFANRSLFERLKRGVAISGKVTIQLAMELCVTLRALNDRGVHVLNLSPEYIFFEWSAGARFTLLADPTAVIPCPGFIPEWRLLESPCAEFREVQPVETSQVFVIGALLLACLRADPELLTQAEFPEGPCSSLAMLAGQPELASGPAERITEPLINELESQAMMVGVNVRKLVEDGLRWCLTEEPEDRFHSLAELSDALKTNIR